jgi:MFS family permease
VANIVYVFCLNVPEVALPLVLVTQLHASPVWAAGVFVTNTVLVVAFQVPVTVWMSRFARRTALAVSGVVLTVSYLGFLAAVEIGHAWAAASVAGVSVVCTLGEIIYAGSSTALVAATAPRPVVGRALARLQLSSGFGLAISPAVITTLAGYSSTALWGSLAAATLLAAASVGLDDRSTVGQRLGTKALRIGLGRQRRRRREGVAARGGDHVGCGQERRDGRSVPVAGPTGCSRRAVQGSEHGVELGGDVRRRRDRSGPGDAGGRGRRRAGGDHESGPAQARQ